MINEILTQLCKTLNEHKKDCISEGEENYKECYFVQTEKYFKKQNRKF